MRQVKSARLLLALSLALTGWTFGCNRPAAESEKGPVPAQAPETRIAAETPKEPAVVPQETLATKDPEAQSQQRVVVVEPEPGQDRGAQADLAARERQIARREADLAARERELERQRKEEATAAADEAAPEDTGTAEESPAAEPAPEEPAEAPAPEPEPVTVPAGTRMEVEFLNDLSSATSSPGDTFRARVASGVTADGALAIPAGSEVLGVVTEAVPLKKIGGKAKLALRFTDLVLPSGTTVPIRASFVEEGPSETKRDAATIGGAAAGGAVIGRILGKGNRSKGAVIGAILGAVAGTAIASKTQGEEVTIPSGTAVRLQLDVPVTVRPPR